MRRGGIVTRRREKREQGRRMRRRALTAGAVLALCAMAMTPELRLKIAQTAKNGVSAVQTLASAVREVEITLPEMTVYALQLGVYDNGERAQSEQQRLNKQGVQSIIWQREKMRIVCSAAKSKAALDLRAADGNEAYVISDTMPQVRLRIRCESGKEEEAAAFIRLPDTLLDELMGGEGRALQQITADTRTLAERALEEHPEHLLYTQLAQSLINWCELTEASAENETAHGYASVMMYTICREWRMALLEDYSASAESTASAQRTPSTAAEVMPPA
ncbi:MAG: hypothetical protein IKU34_09210 [Clostridia bacterium]|nr:hypothetical protein [Clostridia bacterium]